MSPFTCVCVFSRLFLLSMERIIENPCHNYFDYDATGNTSRCIIGECRRVFKGKQATNLESHIISYIFIIIILGLSC